WVATTDGLSVIQRKQMTLAEKADHYLRILLARHVRPPGLVDQCNLKKEGDTSEFLPRDDDNDGQYTNMYLAMESFRYAVTKSPDARANAAKAFRAMRFLQEVTGTSGFVARTVVPSDWKKVHDANEKVSAEDRVDRQVRNPRSKVVENRWRPSADGKWLWKGDTSSDEITGHFYGYLMYYMLAAEEGQERQAVRDLVRRVMDSLIDGGYTLRDIDGQPTLWGVWTPERLNNHPDWRAERWTNALELLSYLQTTYTITGDGKYRKLYLELIERHHFDRLARRPLATEPSESTYFDHELVALAFPGVMTEQEPRLRSVYQEALRFWIGRMKNDVSSYYNFTWASLAGSRDPKAFALEECVSALREQPLDLVQWTVDNRRREDVRMVHAPAIDRPQLDRILPVSERGLMRWDGNPYNVVQGENGMSESSGVFWLLPYWMGRYYGYIGAPAAH
ncbi:MAG: regulator, partial [Acidobacteria bacterium]|nr:regulator [Acidobacteriota bacterium]